VITLASKIAFRVGIVLLVLYVISVIYPYHFGGYSELPKPGEALESTTNSFGVVRKPLGITRFLPIAFFSYLFSYKFIGTKVLVFSTFCIFFGSRRKAKFVHFGITAIAVLITVLAFANMDNYEIINWVLE